MTDSPLFGAFPDLQVCSPKDDTLFSTLLDSSDHGSLTSMNSLTIYTDHWDGSIYGGHVLPDQPQFILPHIPTAISSSVDVSSLQDIHDDTDDAPQPEHILKWKVVRDMAIIVTGTNIYIPQSIYHGAQNAKLKLKEPIIFVTSHPDQWGIAVEDALRARMGDLHGRDHYVFEDCGPSVSIRLQWPGYRSWTKQIPAMDFKSPKSPITKAKLAKNVANCVKRFIDEKERERMDIEADRRWKVGKRFIRMEDLVLVSLHNVSKNSWQPQLRLRTHLSEIQQRRVPQFPSLDV